MPTLPTNEVLFSVTGVKGLATYDSPQFLQVSAREGYRTLLAESLELAECLNFKPVKSGTDFICWETRAGVEKQYDVPAAPENFTITDNSPLLATSTELYYWDGAAWQSLGLLNQIPSFCNIAYLYGDPIGEQVCVVSDYRPHLFRPNQTQKYQICYDVSGKLEDWITGNTEDSSQALNSGGIIACGNVLNTSAWCTHGSPVDDIPILEVQARLKKTGSPTGDVTARLYDTTGTLLATSDAIDASTLTATWDTYTFEFDSGSLSPSSSYYVVIYYDGGAAGTDYVEVALSTASSEGCHFDGTTWTTGTDTALIDVAPGLAPTCSYATVYAGRVWLLNPDGKAGYVHYSNVLNPNDWSAIGSGVLADAQAIAVGDGASPVTALVPLQSSLYIITADKIHRLDGVTPSDFTLYEISQSSSPVGFFAATSANTDGYVLTSAGLVKLSILNQTNKLGQSIVSSRVNNRMSREKLAFIPSENQIWVYKEIDRDDVFVYDLDLGIWSRYEFYGISPTFVTEVDDTVYVCDATGIHKLIPNSYKDNGNFYECYFKSAYSDLGDPFTGKAFTRLNLEIDAPVGGNGYIKLYTDGSYTETFNRPFSIAFSGLTTVGDLYGFTVGDLYGIPVGGTLGGAVIIYDTDVGTSSYAGFDLSGFSWATGAPSIASDYLIDVTCKQIMVEVQITKAVGKLRIRSCGLLGQYLGRIEEGV